MEVEQNGRRETSEQSLTTLGMGPAKPSYRSASSKISTSNSLVEKSGFLAIISWSLPGVATTICPPFFLNCSTSSDNGHPPVSRIVEKGYC